MNTDYLPIVISLLAKAPINRSPQTAHSYTQTNLQTFKRLCVRVLHVICVFDVLN